MAEIESAAEKLKTGLIQDAHADFVQTYNNSALTPTDVKRIAKKYINMYLAQELQLRLNKSLSIETSKP
jgi:hypothetical protein